MKIKLFLLYEKKIVSLCFVQSDELKIPAKISRLQSHTLDNQTFMTGLDFPSFSLSRSQIVILA